MTNGGNNGNLYQEANDNIWGNTSGVPKNVVPCVKCHHEVAPGNGTKMKLSNHTVWDLIHME